MMPLLCALPGAEPWVARLQAHWPCESVPLQLHRFPDGECCPRYGAALAGRDVALVAAPEGPDAGLFALYLCASVGCRCRWGSTVTSQSAQPDSRRATCSEVTPWPGAKAASWRI